MTRARAAAGSVLFFIAAPGTVVGLLPWWLTGWRFTEPLPFWAPLRVLGALMVIAGVGAAIQAFARFAFEGLGTPAPIAAPDRLVVGGVYRYVRNPMYVSLLVAIAGQALLFGQLWLLVYGAAVALASSLFVHFHEEPALRRQFGEQYEAYRRAVPGWWPRLRPWEPG